MKSLKVLALLGIALVFFKTDSSACADRDTKKTTEKKKMEILARSAYKALKATLPQKVEVHPDFLIGNSVFRF